MKTKTILELIWILAVVIILAWAAIANASYIYSHQDSIANPVNIDPLGTVINVTGYQWAWQFTYQNGTTTTDKLVLISNVTYTLIVTSKDVIHDLYIPKFGIQVYAVAGHPNQITFKPTLPGKYIMECVEYCGEYHYEMRGVVVVLP
jgi:heme/copper-type cytochrome/quinol oxidase subunit 2